MSITNEPGVAGDHIAPYPDPHEWDKRFRMHPGGEANLADQSATTGRSSAIVDRRRSTLIRGGSVKQQGRLSPIRDTRTPRAAGSCKASLG